MFKQISETVLKQIIDTAVLAPSGFNLQPWRILSPPATQVIQRNSINHLNLKN